MRLLACLLTGLAAGAGVTHLRSTGLRLPRRQAMVDRASWLRQAGLPWRPWQFHGLAALGGGTALLLLTGLTGAVGVAAVPAFFCAGLPYAVAARRRERRLRAVAEAWPDGLRELVAAVTAGMALSQALAALSSSGAPALREAFAGFEGLARAAGVVAALEAIKADLADPTSDRIIEVLTLAYERGGALVTDILRDLADATTDDLRTAEAIATASLEQRINARAVFALPWIVLLVLTARPGPFRDFYRTGGGLLVVGFGALVSALGITLVSRFARQPIEPRVLAGRPR